MSIQETLMNFIKPRHNKIDSRAVVKREKYIEELKPLLESLSYAELFQLKKERLLMLSIDPEVVESDQQKQSRSHHFQLVIDGEILFQTTRERETMLSLVQSTKQMLLGGSDRYDPQIYYRIEKAIIEEKERVDYSKLNVVRSLLKQVS